MHNELLAQHMIKKRLGNYCPNKSTETINEHGKQ